MYLTVLSGFNYFNAKISFLLTEDMYSCMRAVMPLILIRDLKAVKVE